MYVYVRQYRGKKMFVVPVRKTVQRQKIAEAKKCNGVPTEYCTVQLYVQLFKARAVVLSCNMIGE